jgi:beta-galactosidase
MGRVARIFIVGVIMLMGILSSVYAKNDEISIHRDRLFNSGWKFIRDTVQGAEKPEFDDSRWMTVDLPHDYSIMNLPGEDSHDKIGPFSKNLQAMAVQLAR